MMCFVTPNAWKVFGFLIVFVVLIYVIDYFKFLRFTSITYYTTHRLNDAFAMWFAIPMTALSAVATWWAMKCGYLPHGIGMIALIPSIFLVVYIMILNYLLTKQKSFDLTDATYHETVEEMAQQGKTFDYFNCNPIFCLRNKWLNVGDTKVVGRSRVVPYVPGKYYLQRSNGKSLQVGTPRGDEEEPEFKAGK